MKYSASGQPIKQYGSGQLIEAEVPNTTCPLNGWVLFAAMVTFGAPAMAQEPRYPSRTEIDFEGVEVTGEIVRPSLSLVSEARVNTDMEPMSFAELCASTKRAQDGQLEAKSLVDLRMNAGILTGGYLRLGKHIMCTISPEGGFHYTELNVFETTRGTVVYNTPYDSYTVPLDCAGGSIFGHVEAGRDCTTEGEEKGYKQASMYWDYRVQNGGTVLVPDLGALDALNAADPSVIGKYYGHDRSAGQFPLPSVIVGKLSNAPYGETLYVIFDLASVERSEKDLYLALTNDSWVGFLMEIK
jgi:hypothetical protein